ncbi:MAG: precorrin-4/cobalt-precorrin-4 C11-methyltransferase, partial [Natronomonas sp.]
MTDADDSTDGDPSPDPQAAIDAQREKHAHERDERVYKHTAGDEREGIPFIGA